MAEPEACGLLGVEEAARTPCTNFLAFAENSDDPEVFARVVPPYRVVKIRAPNGRVWCLDGQEVLGAVISLGRSTVSPDAVLWHAFQPGHFAPCLLSSQQLVDLTDRIEAGPLLEANVRAYLEHRALYHSAELAIQRSDFSYFLAVRSFRVLTPDESTTLLLDAMDRRRATIVRWMLTTPQTWSVYLGDTLLHALQYDSTDVVVAVLESAAAFPDAVFGYNRLRSSAEQVDALYVALLQRPSDGVSIFRTLYTRLAPPNPDLFDSIAQQAAPNEIEYEVAQAWVSMPMSPDEGYDLAQRALVAHRDTFFAVLALRFADSWSFEQWLALRNTYLEPAWPDNPLGRARVAEILRIGIERSAPAQDPTPT